MKRQTIIFFLLSLAHFGMDAQQAFTLEEAIAYAQDHSTTVKLERLKIADAEGQIDEYTSIGIPKINAKAGYTHYFDIPTQILPDFLSPAVYNILFEEDLLERRDLETAGGIPAQFGTSNILDVGVELQTLIVDGSYFVGLQAQKLYRDLVAKQYDATLYGLKESISLAYLSVLNVDQNLGLLDNNISNLQKLYDETFEIYQAGFAEKLDADRLKLSLQNLQTERDNLVRLREVAIYSLKFNMGYPMNQNIQLSDSFEDHVNKAQVEKIELGDNESFYQQRPEYAPLETAVELQDMNIRSIKMGYFPSLSGFASYGGQLQRNDLFDSNDNDWFKTSLVGLQLNVPIFDGLEKRAKIQRAKISKSQSEIQKSLFERQVDLQVNANYLEYLNAKEKVKSTQENLDLAQEIYDVTQIKFKEGVGSSVEVSQAESELYRSQSNNSAALFDLINANIKLKSALGQL